MIRSIMTRIVILNIKLVADKGIIAGSGIYMTIENQGYL